MKLLTLNFHNFPHGPGEIARRELADAIAKERPQIVALQELYQEADNLPSDPLAPLLALLRQQGAHYYGIWQGIKRGYEHYHEGLALLSQSPITERVCLPVSRSADYDHWKTRKLLGIRTRAHPHDLFFSVHYGWWNDADEPFSTQWTNTKEALAPLQTSSRIWLMGDFNNPAEVRGEGYDCMRADGWQDCYALAAHREGEATVADAIDGWQESRGKKRMDFILCDRPVSVERVQVVFDGVRYPVLSDHYGVLAQISEDFPKAENFLNIEHFSNRQDFPNAQHFSNSQNFPQREAMG